jgi:hypothetical protein
MLSTSMLLIVIILGALFVYNNKHILWKNLA